MDLIIQQSVGNEKRIKALSGILFRVIDHALINLTILLLYYGILKIDVEAIAIPRVSTVIDPVINTIKTP